MPNHSELKKENGKIIIPEKMIIVLEEKSITRGEMEDLRKTVIEIAGVKTVYFHYKQS